MESPPSITWSIPEAWHLCHGPVGFPYRRTGAAVPLSHPVFLPLCHCMVTSHVRSLQVSQEADFPPCSWSTSSSCDASGQTPQTSRLLLGLHLSACLSLTCTMSLWTWVGCLGRMVHWEGYNKISVRMFSLPPNFLLHSSQIFWKKAKNPPPKLTTLTNQSTKKRKGYAKCWHFFMIVIAFILI